MDVLIVEDDADLRGSLTKALESAGLMVVAVDNGLAALAELQEQSAHAILCDIRMPFLEGRRFFDELEQSLPVMAKRVIFITGIEARAARALRQRTGQPVLRKPLELQELVQAIRLMLYRHDSPA